MQVTAVQNSTYYTPVQPVQPVAPVKGKDSDGDKDNGSHVEKVQSSNPPGVGNTLDISV